MAIVFDAETDGLLDKVSKIHCLVNRDTETEEIFKCFHGGSKRGHFEVIDGLMMLQESKDILVPHNGIKYDVPVIEKLYPQIVIPKAQVFDTLIGARLVYSNLKDIDAGLLKKGKIPGKLYGMHSLKAWGYRMGLHKGDYADVFKENFIATHGKEAWVDGLEWLEFSEDMLEYCAQDTAVTAELYQRILAKEYSPLALDIEHRIAWLMAQQERNGFCFNEAAAGELYAKLAQRRGELDRECAELFEPWQVRLADLIPKRDNKTRGYIKGIPVAKYKTVAFNPNSRPHIANRLQTLYGWEPEDFTPSGQPKVDDEVMAKLDYPPCKILTEFLLVSKRISQLAEGDNAWLKLVRNGKIHGNINPNGAVTGRATHSYPNLSQVPAGTAPYGKDCRGLYGAPPGWLLVGADASGLELRGLAHFMARYDGGKYTSILLTGDIHWANAQAMGLTKEIRDSQSAYHDVLRGGAKTFIYGFLYGAGDEKAGRIVFDIITSCRTQGMPYQDLLDSFFGGNERPSSEDLKAAGGKLKRSFLRKLPALKKLIDAVKAVAKKNRHLKGMDGRLIHIRSLHSALNTLLQGSGALVCKYWLILLNDELQARGYRHGWDGDYAFCVWSHDECQIACRTPEMAAVVAKLAPEMVTKSGEFFNFRCRLDGESKTGLTWADTH